jgi:uncharacterized circularly permuted ATP-grasp superfamily protein/uncharacterized alpha-E superfamily protein
LAGERPFAGRTTVHRSRVDAWTQAYAPLPGIPDEFIGADGEPRPHWLEFLTALARFGQLEIDQRFAGADRRIRDMGISYRAYGETKERSWPLSRLPLLISETEWNDISAGIAQRAELLEKVLADLYGPARLVAEGALPAAAVAGSPDFLRPLRGVAPPGGRWLHLYAADIGRGPDGRWWVLGDRAQAPSGTGYALENRLVVSQAFPTLYSAMKVQRLAPFFRDFRAGLSAAAVRAEPRICLLTPGPWSQTYFEQAYLARYLGFLLVEGEDLVMSEGRIHVRTIAGLKRADVIWRRVDADWCDPLELNAASHLGVSGMLDAIRGGAVAIANMPGAGLIEARALMGFMPSLARRLLNENLLLPNIATWWCGQEQERAEVLESLDHMAISGAFTETVPGFGDRRIVIGSDLDAGERARLLESIRTRGIDYVGQEIARLSTTPFWEDGALAPRPFALRVFAAATPDGWKVMPGGFCRISDRSDVRAVSMGEGVQSADVWVLSTEPVAMSTLLPTSENVAIVRLLGNLPSRAADNLFWLGRYLERVEATLRVVRCLSGRIMEPDTPSNGTRQPVERLQRLLATWGALRVMTPRGASAEIAFLAMRDETNSGSALSIARAARRAASVIRERLSQDVWQLIGNLQTRLTDLPASGASEPDVLEHAEAGLHIIAALSGLISENFNRVAGWNFLDMGRRIERGINTCHFVRQFADRDATAESLDVLLDLIDSQITYRSRYLIGVALAPVRDMALLDPFNPRSVCFQVIRLDEHLAGLPVLHQDGMLETPRRLTTRLRADLAIEDAGGLDMNIIADVERQLTHIGDAVADRYFLQSSATGLPPTQMDLG